MQRFGVTSLLAAIACAALAASPARAQNEGGWTALFDGKNLDNFNKVGDANWRIEDGAVVADKGTSGFLVTKNSYGDYQLRAEFWADEDVNSGIYMRCANPAEPTDKTCYEANIYDKRPDPTYGTGAITNFAKVEPIWKVGGKWNTYEITAKGPEITVVLNGQTTVAGFKNDQLKSGPIALQYAASVVKDKGVIKFRKVEIKPL